VKLDRREKIILAGLVTVAAVGAMLVASPDADASPTSYLQRLNDYGISVYDTGLALQTGYAICGALDNVSPARVTYNLYNITGSDVPNYDVAAAWVAASIEELC